MDSTGKFISILWFIWGGVLIVTFVGMTLMLPLFGDDTRGAWEWFIPNLFPPLGLVLGVNYAQKGATVTATAKPGVIAAGWTVIGLSTLYLLLLTISVLGCTFADKPLETLRMANLWLGPLLALSTATLGTRFAS